MFITLIAFIIFIYSIILHEIAHGVVAERLGDPTARLSGRLTLNPLPHLDPVMSVLLPLFLRLTGFPIIFGSAKPVPIDPYNLRNVRQDMGLVGIAGPATNLGLAIILSLVARLSFAFFPNAYLLSILGQATQMNIILAVFNLIPIPPLDGGRVAVALLPENLGRSLENMERFGLMVVFFLLLFPTPLLPLSAIVIRIANLIFGLVFPNFPLI